MVLFGGYDLLDIWRFGELGVALFRCGILGGWVDGVFDWLVHSVGGRFWGNESFKMEILPLNVFLLGVWLTRNFCIDDGIFFVSIR